MTHTPGPWAIGKNPNYPNHIDARDPLMRGNLNLVRIAEVFPIGGNDDQQHMANMSLIAAAPDLLKALKDALSILESEFPNPAPNGQIVRARAAIAKATGETV